MSAIMQRLKKWGRVLRGDHWQNTQSGLGVVNRDKRMGSIFVESPVIQYESLEALFEGDPLAARIIEKPVDDALRKGIGISLKAKKGETEDIGKLQQMEADVESAFDDLLVVPRFHEACVWGRLFGGAAIFPILEDGKNVTEPINMDGIKKVYSLLVMDCKSVFPEHYSNDPKDPLFGQPDLYRIIHTGAQGHTFMATVHASRLITFEGVLTTERAKQRNNGWSLSVLQRIYEVLREFNAGFDSAGVLLHEASIGVLKLRGLIEALSSNEESVIRSRLEILDLAKSVVRSLVLDADGGEEFRRETVNFGSIPDLLDRFALRLAAAVDMPLTVLMGQAPAGMNATGESDQTLWDNHVQTVQTVKMKPRLDRLAEIIMRSKDGPTNGVIPDNWGVTFPPLRQMTEIQTADLRGKVADSDVKYHTMGAVSAAEVAMSRFGPKGWSMETTVDLDALAEEAEADKDERQRLRENPDTVPPGGEQTDPQTIAAIKEVDEEEEGTVTVNQARANQGMGVKMRPDGTEDPDGKMSVGEFRAKLGQRDGSHEEDEIPHIHDTPDGPTGVDIEVEAVDGLEMHVHSTSKGRTGPSPDIDAHTHTLPGGGKTSGPKDVEGDSVHREEDD